MNLTQEQLNNLSRDYTNYTWQYGEPICEEDLQYLYIDLNLSKEEISSILNLSIGKIYRHLKLYNIKKSREQINELSKRINLETYGNEFPSKLQQFKDKQQNTCLEKYGSKSYLTTEEGKQKTLQHNMEKYGVAHHAQSEQFKSKNRQNCMEKYGVETYFETEEFKQKAQQTLKQKYGDKPYSNKQIRDKYKDTCSKKYGVDNCFKDKNVKQQIKDKQTDINIKKYNTRQRNNTFNTSKPENYIWNKLNELFPQAVLTQYKSDVYPFACDFYIIELDLYIEYQGFWTHGKEPYNAQNEKHKQLLNYWHKKADEINFKAEYKNLYRNAVHIWTVKDPEKRHIAKENKLNWLEFFTLEQFDNWYNDITQMLKKGEC